MPQRYYFGTVTPTPLALIPKSADDRVPAGNPYRQCRSIFQNVSQKFVTDRDCAGFKNGVSYLLT
jgi:hypothetical protein